MGSIDDPKEKSFWKLIGDLFIYLFIYLFI